MTEKTSKFKKVSLYLNKRSLVYAFKHPSLAVKSAIRLTRSDSSPSKFVCSLLTISAENLQSLTPTEESRKYIERAFQASIAPSTGEMPASLEEGWSLYYIVRALKPTFVIETGVSAGRSSTFILSALRDNRKGQLYSIDTNPKSGYAIPEDLKDRWHFLNARSDEVLPALLRELGKIQVFLHDSLHTYDCMLYEYSTAWPYLEKDAVLLSDDVDRNSAIIGFCRDVNTEVISLSKDFAGCKKCT
jgi:hypothetical protein